MFLFSFIILESLHRLVMLINWFLYFNLNNHFLFWLWCFPIRLRFLVRSWSRLPVCWCCWRLRWWRNFGLLIWRGRILLILLLEWRRRSLQIVLVNNLWLEYLTVIKVWVKIRRLHCYLLLIIHWRNVHWVHHAVLWLVLKTIHLPEILVIFLLFKVWLIASRNVLWFKEPWLLLVLILILIHFKILINCVLLSFVIGLHQLVINNLLVFT